ncbi:hypothetical protein MAM1_0307d09499 [Mucor ambiguus]|uniref:LIM zinc-binding domain-containing protein n=1 Tax=Mucor ambiguus TaxID=91626 RepID=A0A0C9MGT8_9FUNG|nr:hypothetical protein MAM1_0307d09499 [Mucor ambiguus]
MGFCQRCGEITAGKCSKCGGRSVQSTISSLVSEGGVSVIDRWQSQYAGTILSPEEVVPKSPTAKRIPVTQSAFYDPISKLCTCCSRALEYKHVVQEENLSYCKECHLKLFSKGACPTCHKVVCSNQSYIEYAKKCWHTECFVCFQCRKQLDANPLVDLQNRPCCEPCFMSQAGRGRRGRNSCPSIDKSIRTRLEDLSLIPPPLSRTPSPIHTKEEEEEPKEIPRNHRLTSMFIPPASSQSTPIPKKSSLSQRPCHHCHEPLGDATRKKIKIAIGPPQQYAWFHKSCFLCSRCHLPFKDGECATDGKTFYHEHCNRYCYGCDQPIKQDSFKFNNKAYHFDCFKCHANGCKIALGDPVFEINDKPFCHACHAFTLMPRKKMLRLGGSKTCPRCQCSVSIMDDTPGPLATRWHKKCLCCIKCHKQLDSAAKMRQDEQGFSFVFCTSCV